VALAGPTGADESLAVAPKWIAFDSQVAGLPLDGIGRGISGLAIAGPARSVAAESSNRVPSTIPSAVGVRTIISKNKFCRTAQTNPCAIAEGKLQQAHFIFQGKCSRRQDLARFPSFLLLTMTALQAGRAIDLCDVDNSFAGELNRTLS